MTRILDGKLLAKRYRQELKGRVDELKKTGRRPPGLGVILVGENPASLSYVKSKEKVAHECGIETPELRLPTTASQKEVEQAIAEFNQSEEVDGILLQLPLPKGLIEEPLLQQILFQKDADGLHPMNQGLLLQGQGVVRPCTPIGVMKLIDWYYSGSEALLDLPSDTDLSGKRAVVIGRSNLVGKPVAALLLERNATVTMAHSRTADLPSICREADILVVAVGRPMLVQREWVKPGALVIDVGINRIDSGALVGDVNFNEVKEVAGGITPAPGGVGPMTVAMLLWNTYLLRTQQGNES